MSSTAAVGFLMSVVDVRALQVRGRRVFPSDDAIFRAIAAKQLRPVWRGRRQYFRAGDVMRYVNEHFAGF